MQRWRWSSPERWRWRSSPAGRRPIRARRRRCRGCRRPFLGTAVVGSGGLTAAIDAYGDVVDLRAPGPAGRALIDNPAERQAAGTRARPTPGSCRGSASAAGRRCRCGAPTRSRQRYLPGTNVVRTEARFGRVRVERRCCRGAAAGADRLPSAAPSGASGLGLEVGGEPHCGQRGARSRLRCVDATGARAPRGSSPRADRRRPALARPGAAARRRRPGLGAAACTGARCWPCGR